MNARTSRANAVHTRQRTLFWMTAILLAGAGLRLFQLDTVSLRGDEAFTVLHWMREPIAQTLATIATSDPQPPLTYALYRGFGLIFGTSEGVVRLLPALLNLLGVPAMYGVGKRIGGERVGLAAAALFAASPAILWHAQDARSYGLWIAVSALALWLALRAVERGRIVDWALFVAIQITAAYLYYLELLFLVGLTVYVLMTYRHSRGALLRWLIALGVIGLALALWYLQPRLLSGGGYTGTAGQLDLAAYVTQFLPTLLFGQAIPAGRELWFTAAAVVTGLAGLAVLWRTKRRSVWLIVLYAGLPLLALGLIATRLNVFVPRYVLPVALALIVLAAVVIVRGLSPSNKAVPLRLLAIALPVLIGWSLFTYYFDYAKAPDWRALAAYLAPRTNTTDLLVNSAADMSFPFYLGEFRVRGEHVQLPANPDQTQDEIEGTLAEALFAGRRIWIVAQPPDWPNRAIPDDWLNANAYPMFATEIGGLRAESFETPLISAGGLSGDFGPVQLIGAERPPLIEPDGSLPMVLAFEVSEQTGAPLKTFVHVIGPVNPATGTPLWAQDDQPPQDQIDTRTWRPGLRYRDRFVLPGLDQLPPGAYTVVAGWYDPVTNERLQTDSGDSVALLELVVAPDGVMTMRNPQP